MLDGAGHAPGHAAKAVRESSARGGCCCPPGGQQGPNRHLSSELVCGGQLCDAPLQVLQRRRQAAARGGPADGLLCLLQHAPQRLPGLAALAGPLLCALLLVCAPCSFRLLLLSPAGRCPSPSSVPNPIVSVPGERKKAICMPTAGVRQGAYYAGAGPQHRSCRGDMSVTENAVAIGPVRVLLAHQGAGRMHCDKHGHIYREQDERWPRTAGVERSESLRQEMLLPAQLQTQGVLGQHPQRRSGWQW